MISLPEKWSPKPPASEAAIRKLLLDTTVQIPAAYLHLLRMTNGGFAELSKSPWAIDFWAAEDINRLNHEYGLDESAPEFLAIASNLGEELIAFDRQEEAQSGVYMLPWHSPDKTDALQVTDNFEKLVAMIVNPNDS